jgi:23S rRNA G2445 N2-methylase RlmL
VNGLDTASRDALERAIRKGRQLLEEDLAEAAEGRLGIYADGAIDSEDALRLPSGELGERREVVEVLTHLRREGETAEGAVGRLIREAAFTHLNRLVAIRVAEAIDLLPPSLAQGKASQGFRDVLEVAPLLAADTTGGYWTYLRLCGDELAADDPVLFDPRNPLLTLAPSPAALDQLVEILANPRLAAAWTAPDTLGWTYQFFNTDEERRQMRDESPAPRTSRELAVRNQFFTPRYVVDFLVQNSLGRRLLEADPASGLIDELPLLVDPPNRRGRPLPLDEVRVLDPACGSGHFLLGCYDLLELAWQRAGVKPAEAAARILPCLWGVDIDPRCAQVASAALMLRARRASREGTLPRPNVVTARALPEDPEAWRRALVGLSWGSRRLIDSFREALTQAPLLGPLLKVEERLTAEIGRVVPEANAEGTLFGAMGTAADAFGRAETDVLAAVQRVADEAGSTAAERLLAAEASDAIRFVEAMRQRYDAVLMNPPFGEPIPETKPYLRTAYPWIPTRDYNLLAAFVGRGLELCRASGYLGAITSRTGMFLTTFERWRREVLLGHRLVAFADLGHGVMEHALVEAAAYVVGAELPAASDVATFVRLLKDTNRPGALLQAVADIRSAIENPRIFRVRLTDLDTVPRSPMAYWMSPSIRRLFTDLPRLEGNGAEVRVGLQTGDDFRFVRAFWEVDPARIARNREETRRGRRWAPFAKGGEYSPFWADIHLVVDYEDDGRRPREYQGSRVQNARYYFRPGLTWPAHTTSGLGMRLLPTGCVFGHAGPSVFPTGKTSYLILSWLTSRIAKACIDASLAAADEVTSGGAKRKYEVGLLQNVPWPGLLLGEDEASALANTAEQLAWRRLKEDASDETSRRFIRPTILPNRGSSFESAIAAAIAARHHAAITDMEAIASAEAILCQTLNLDADAEAYLDEEIGPQPASYPLGPVDDVDLFAHLMTSPIDHVIDEVVTKRGGSRAITHKTYVADRRLEVLAHAFKRHPQVLEKARKGLGLLPPEEPRMSAEDFVSYLVGVAFGRWDVRIGRDPSLAPPQPGLFDPVPLCPPGMLVNDDGLPARKVPPGYPLTLPPDRLLVDEPGHQWDIEAAVRQAAAVLVDDSEAFLAEVEGILGYRSLRAYLRKQFFGDHLGRYSKSRRKAPIYWHLSVPSRAWGVWVYAPALTREALYAVASHAARRLAVGTERAAALRAERDAGGRGRSAREADRHLEAEEELVNALQAFRAEAERVAGLGWEPDLDDGIILCAAPLAGLFPAWRQAAEERAKLRKGAYPWASVSRWRDAL